MKSRIVGAPTDEGGAPNRDPLARRARPAVRVVDIVHAGTGLARARRGPARPRPPRPGPARTPPSARVISAAPTGRRPSDSAPAHSRPGRSSRARSAT